MSLVSCCEIYKKRSFKQQRILEYIFYMKEMRENFFW